MPLGAMMQGLGMAAQPAALYGASSKENAWRARALAEQMAMLREQMSQEQAGRTEELGLRRLGLQQQHELGLGGLDVARQQALAGQRGQEAELGLRRELGLGSLGVQREQAGLQRELGMGGLGIQREQMGQQGRQAEAQQRLDERRLELQEQLQQGQLTMAQAQAANQQAEQAWQHEMAELAPQQAFSTSEAQQLGAMATAGQVKPEDYFSRVQKLRQQFPRRGAGLGGLQAAPGPLSAESPDLGGRLTSAAGEQADVDLAEYVKGLIARNPGDTETGPGVFRDFAADAVRAGTPPAQVRPAYFRAVTAYVLKYKPSQYGMWKRLLAHEQGQEREAGLAGLMPSANQSMLERPAALARR